MKIKNKIISCTNKNILQSILVLLITIQLLVSVFLVISYCKHEEILNKLTGSDGIVYSREDVSNFENNINWLRKNQELLRLDIVQIGGLGSDIKTTYLYNVDNYGGSYYFNPSSNYVSFHMNRGGNLYVDLRDVLVDSGYVFKKGGVCGGETSCMLDIDGLRSENYFELEKK